MMVDFEIPTDIAAAILSRGAEIAAARTKSAAVPRRTGYAARVMEQAQAGLLPEAMKVPHSNRHVAGHAEKLLALVKAGDVDALRDHAITGTNSYAKMLRAYQAALVAYVEKMEAKALAGEPVAVPGSPAEVIAKAQRKRAAKKQAA